MNPRSKTIVAALALCALATAGLAVAGTLDPSAIDSYTERVPTGFINWGEGYAEVKISATYDTERFGASHAKIRAIEEAEKLADRSLFRLLRGINIDGQQRLAGNPALEEALKKVIKKQKNMKDQKTTNVTMEATFRVPLYGRRAVTGLVYGQLDEANLTAGAAAGAGSEYTSVVFDASGTSLQAALFPRVYGSGGELLYGPGNLDKKGIARGAPVTYLAPEVESGKKSGLAKSLARRLGESPLVIKVDKIRGDFLADIELRNEQEQILRQAQIGDLLASGQVFVLQTASVDVSQ